MTPAPCLHEACTVSPVAVLDHHATLNSLLVAYVLNLRVTRGAHRGELSRSIALQYMHPETGVLRLVDPTQPPHRWSVSAAEVRRYVDHGPAVKTELRSVS
jgi:hypothetical protein